MIYHDKYKNFSLLDSKLQQKKPWICFNETNNSKDQSPFLETNIAKLITWGVPFTQPIASLSNSQEQATGPFPVSVEFHAETCILFL
jgi:hypothetical protein